MMGEDTAKGVSGRLMPKKLTTVHNRTNRTDNTRTHYPTLLQHHNMEVQAKYSLTQAKI